MLQGPLPFCWIYLCLTIKVKVDCHIREVVEQISNQLTANVQALALLVEYLTANVVRA